MSPMMERLGRIEAALRRHGVSETFELGLILGSGLGQLVDAIADAQRIPYAEIDGFPTSTAPGHAGQLVLGRLAGRKVVAMQGRFHLYEGWGAQDVACPVYAMHRLGCRHLVVTNAAGALNPDFAPGQVMLIDDHINLLGVSPLTGPNDERLGLRFPDLSRAYWPAHRELVAAQADRQGIALQRGIYVATPGPSLETSAERRFMRGAGGDAVGMSTVLEVIAANHAGLQVLGLSAICNVATGSKHQQPDTIEEVLAHAAHAGVHIARLLEACLPDLA
nr:purine-nucleoside phosphorylase [uncultured Roseateles sp.]